MDLSFPRPIAAGEAALSPADMALLVAALAARSDASVTAKTQALLDGTSADAATQALLAPADGAFNGAMAARLAAWREA